VYLASQVRGSDKGFLSTDITVGQLVEYRGDIHHIFLRHYLRKQGYSRGRYNQIANYVMMQSEINIQVGDKRPEVYFNELRTQCETGIKKYGNIDSMDLLKENFKEHCIPDIVFNANHEDYADFLAERRILMSNKIKDYYSTL
jgi:hypothetical protein